MTNTCITDVEILERRYPVIVRQFGIRPASGGHGQFHGGDGVIRALEFTKPLVVSILSERRAFQPYGMAGGENGARGQNLLYYAQEQRTVSLGGKNTVSVAPGDRLTIFTPGGGGYGAPSNEAVPAAAVAPGTPLNPVEMKTSGSLSQYVMNQESV